MILKFFRDDQRIKTEYLKDHTKMKKKAASGDSSLIIDTETTPAESFLPTLAIRNSCTSCVVPKTF